MGGLFGPIMILWFSILGYLGLVSLVRTPSILLGFNPYYGISLVMGAPQISEIQCATSGDRQTSRRKRD